MIVSLGQPSTTVGRLGLADSVVSVIQKFSGMQLKQGAIQVLYSCWICLSKVFLKNERLAMQAGQPWCELPCDMQLTRD